MTTRKNDRRGATAIIVMALVVPIVTIGYFAISLANIQRNEATSQIAADLAATHCGAMLATDKIQLADVKRTAQGLVIWNSGLNTNTGRTIRPQNLKTTIEFGSTSFDSTNPTFTKDAKPINSIRVQVGATVGFAVFGKRISQLDVDSNAAVANVERDICLVVDRSGSMTFDLSSGDWITSQEPDPDNPLSTHHLPRYRKHSFQWWWGWPHPRRSRWSRLIPAIRGLADELNQTRQEETLSIVSYSSEVEEQRWDRDMQIKTFRSTDSSVESQPTQDYEKIIRELEYKYSNEFPIMGATNIAAGIDAAAEVLLKNNQRPNAFKTMIVMTDGQYNQGRAPWLAAADAAKKGIQVYTVTFSEQADQISMIRTAAAGKGMHFHAPDGSKLEEIFRTIANLPPRVIVE